jgi:hypothetical protein
MVSATPKELFMNQIGATQAFTATKTLKGHLESTLSAANQPQIALYTHNKEKDSFTKREKLNSG